MTLADDFRQCVSVAEWKRLLARVEKMEAALFENVGDAYNLLTQGELPTQRRQPSTQRIYDRSRAALDREEAEA